MTAETSYDRVAYPGFPFAETHPDHLAVMASLQGMSPAPAERCRVLELGCGDGGNLIPMAYHLPDSAFLGVDISGRAVATGNETIAALGLKNITLQHRDITELADEDGEFDYIIAHGVYSWVPQPVRDRILDIFARRLAPQGVAYVSYNALPGGHLREVARSIMLFHVRDLVDDRQRSIQARVLLDLVAEASTPDRAYGIVLRQQRDILRKVPDHLLIHDNLNTSSQAFFFYQVVEAAARRGLQYVSEASPFTSSRLLRDEARKLIDAIPDNEVVVREQYWDFVRGTAFRQTMFCRHDVELRRIRSPDCVTGYFVAGDVRPATDDIDPMLNDPVEFRNAKGDTLATSSKLAKAAFIVLGQAWPRQLAFTELLAAARALLAEKGDDASDEEIVSLPQVLHGAFEVGFVQLHRTPRPTAAISERPVASLLARWQVGRGPFLTSTLHSPVVIDDEIGRRFLRLLDGTRTVEDLVADLRTASADIPDSQRKENEPPISAEMVRQKLGQLARLGLLIG